MSTPIPVLVPAPHAELAVPYMTPAGFQAFPTWLDLDNLIPGGVASLQTSELADVLLQASQWCISECQNMALHGHWVQNENQRTRASGSGRLYIKPRDIPVRAVTALSYGWDPSFMYPDVLPDPTMWIEDGREVSFSPGGAAAQFSGTVLQFGPSFTGGSLTYVQWSYVAGYPNATLSASCLAAAASVSVTDPAGILPGDVLRIYDEGATQTGANEALTVASTYVPALPTIPPTATSIPIAGTTQFAHAAGTMITGMPRDIMQSVIAFAVALLMREDVASEAPLATSPFTAAARSTAGARGGQAGSLINDAYGWLARYAPAWRS